jgi:hypothetical protein
MNAWKNLLLVTLAAGIATFASGQAVALDGNGTQGTPSIPDFSGIWVHPYFPGIEPPASGPGPVLNKSRRPDGVSNIKQFVGDYANPILKPQAAEVVKRHAEISLAGMAYPTPSNQCWPSGVPYIFFQIGIQVLQQPHQVTLLYLRDHEVRQVRLNQPHPAQVTPSWYGDSAGYYEGDTLVIDTVGVKVDRPFAMVDMYGAPYSRELHVVERYRLIDHAAAKEAIARSNKENAKVMDPDFDPDYRGKHLQLVFTVVDEGVFTMPWSAAVTYAPPLLREWQEDVCAENTLGFYSTGKDAAVPNASKLDF